MGWFNCYGDPRWGGLTRIVTTTVDLDTLPLPQWTTEEVAYRLAYIYPQVDGHEYETAPESVKTEVRALMAELERRGYDPIYNLQSNERNSGWGWLPWLCKVSEKRNLQGYSRG